MILGALIGGLEEIFKLGAEVLGPIKERGLAIIFGCLCLLAFFVFGLHCGQIATVLL